MHDWIAYSITFTIGLVIGVATLPWKHRLDPLDKTYMYVLGWTCFWPYFILLAIWHGFKVYREAWWDYLSYEEHRRKQKPD